MPNHGPSPGMQSPGLGNQGPGGPIPNHGSGGNMHSPGMSPGHGMPNQGGPGMQNQGQMMNHGPGGRLSNHGPPGGPRLSNHGPGPGMSNMAMDDSVLSSHFSGMSLGGAGGPPGPKFTTPIKVSCRSVHIS